MTAYQTKIVVLHADPERDHILDVRDHPTAVDATGSYYMRVTLGRDLPATHDGDILRAELILDGALEERRWYLAGDDYLLPITEDQLLTHLGEQLANDAADYLQAALGPGASH